MRIREVLGALSLVLGLAMPVAAERPDMVPAARADMGGPGDHSAMRGERHFGGWHRQGGHRHGGRGRSVIGLALRHRQALGLTAQQVEGLQKLGMDLRRAAIQRAADRQLAALDLMSLRRSDPVDMGKVEAKVREIERLRADGRIAAIRTGEQAKAQLTPEQREKLKALQAARWQRRGPGSGGMESPSRS
jgi:Spy/CpxP family protein refolding chaperone